MMYVGVLKVDCEVMGIIDNLVWLLVGVEYFSDLIYDFE